MPTQLRARPARDALEERHVRKLAHPSPSQAPAEWMVHAKMGAHTVGWHPSTAADCRGAAVPRCRGAGVLGCWGVIRSRSANACMPSLRADSTGWACRPAPAGGRAAPHSNAARSAPRRGQAAAAGHAPRQPDRRGDDAGPRWCAGGDARPADRCRPAQQRGRQVVRRQVPHSQVVRRICRRKRVRRQRTRWWATSTVPDCAPPGPQGRASSRAPPRRPQARGSSRVDALDELDPARSPRATSRPLLAGLPCRWPPHRLKGPLDDERGPDHVGWGSGALAVGATGRR